MIDTELYCFFNVALPLCRMTIYATKLPIRLTDQIARLGDPQMLFANSDKTSKQQDVEDDIYPEFR